MHAFAAVSSLPASPHCRVLVARISPRAMRTSMAMRARGVHLLVCFDGGSRGNPGPSGCGAVVADARDGAVLLSVSHYMREHATNNEAEYTAALLGVTEAARLAKKLPVERLTLQGDSMLVIKQLSGEWKVTKPHLVSLRKKLLGAVEQAFDGRYDARFVPREDNTLPDALANKAMDSRKGIKRKQNVGALARLATELGLEKGALLATDEAARGAAPPRPASPEQQPSAVPATATASISAMAAAVEAEGAVAGEGSPDLSLSEIRKLRKADLQRGCRERGLREDGCVEDLRERLRTVLRESESRKMIALVDAQRRGLGAAGAAEPLVKPS